MLGPLDFQRHVQPTPGLQPSLPGQQAGLLSLKAGQRLELLPHLLTDLPGLFHRAAAQELFFRDGVALDKDTILQLGIPLDGRQGSVYISDLAFGDGEAGVLPLQQGGPGRVGQLFVRLTDLQAAQVQQPFEQFLPSVGHGDDPELFHFYNGHLSDSQPFRQ